MAAIQYWLLRGSGLMLGLALTACSTSHIQQSGGNLDTALRQSPEQRFEWKSSTPEAQGVDSQELVRALQQVSLQDIRLHGLIIYRNGHVITEVYPPPYNAETVHNIKSVSKSLLSALVGIALEQGMLSSIDQPVADFFPDYLEAGEASGKQDITIRHLLTMTAGLELDENGPLMKDVFSSNDWIDATLKRPQVEPPGQHFVYSTALTHLMAALLSRASDSNLLELCQRYLCGPLEFEGMRWRTGPSGYYFGGAEVYLRPRDMLKFGLLYLNEGYWQGQQLVPKSWVQTSTRNHLQMATSDEPYGYWWWPVDNGYMGIGWGGQRLLVVPDKNLVIAATFADPDGFDRIFAELDLERLAMTPLAPNLSAVERLREIIQSLENPAPKPVPPLPDLARTISGKTFSLSSDAHTPLIKYLRFDFSDGDDHSLSIDTGTVSQRLALGLDGRFRITPTGRLGRLPGDNQMALRGQWVDEASFKLELVGIGEPLYTELTIRFENERIVVNGQLQPTGRELTLEGRLSDHQIAGPIARPDGR